MRNGTSRDCRFWTMVATGILSLMLRQVPTAQAAVATGGNITTNYAANGTNYCAHIFTTPGTTNLTFTTGGNVEVLLVAGGGGGGSGGGGAGGFLTTFTNITTTGPITVTVGMGGLHGSAAITGKNGSNSVFGALTAIGGGGGTLHDTATGKDGGSGGGAGGASGALTYTGGFGTAGQGNNGGSIVNKTTPYGAAGGGGAGALGSNVVTTGVSGKGGNGTNSSISGNSVTYAGGGGGGTYNAGGTDGAGGLGGGGAGGVGGTNGTANTGGGGGGTRNGYLAGDGGSGIVIVRYPRELIVEALPASGVSTNSAMLNGILALNGGINADVYFCWGYTNAGTNSLTDWAHYSLQATNWGSAAFSTKLTGLLSGSGYVYRCFASNSAATAWSGTQGFTTVYRPAVINLGSIDAVDGNTLQGQITDTGFDTTYAWFYWWPVGGSTSSVAMGSQTGTFSAALYQLVPSQNYQYQVLASNLAGPVWSMVSNFTCLSKAWYAATNGNNGGGTNWTTAYSTLSNALNYVQNNDTLYVAGQTFNLTTQVNLIAKRGGSILGGYQAASDAVLPGPNDPAAWPTVWRRASGTTNRILYLDGLTNCLLRGLTLREGATSSSGAGVYLTQCRGVTMDRCTIVTNVVTGAGQSGGGIYAVSSVLTLTNCLIATNSATGLYNSYGLGGGVCLASGMLTVEACHVTRNAAWGNNLGAPYPHGGGIWLGAGTTSTIVRTVVDRNVATALGGGIYSQGKMDLVNSLVIHNDSTSTDDGDGICLANANGRATILNCTIADNGNGVGILYAQGTVCMTNSIVWGHSDDLKGFPTDGQIIPTVSNVAYCCIQGGDNNGVQGCFSIDPLFADTNYFHLRSKQGYYGNGYFSGGAWTTATSNSPLIDMGDPAFAFVQEPAPNRGRINLGAYGNTEVASMSDTTTVFTLPAVSNPGATLVGHRTVGLAGVITDTGGQSPSVWLYYWMAGNASTSVVWAGLQDGGFVRDVGDLVPATSYGYYALASNSAGTATSSVSAFFTHPSPSSLYVSTNGGNTAGSKWSTAFTHLPAVLNIFEDGDTVYLAGHTFARSPGYDQEDLWYWSGNSDVTLAGGYQAASDAVLPGPNDPALWPTVWRRASGTTRILYLDGLTNCLLRGLTLREGATSSSGAGVYVTQCRGMTLDRCTIVTNTVTGAGKSGGGIYAVSSVLTLTNCLIATNSANGIYNSWGLGGGVCLASGVLTIDTCRVTRNAAWGIASGAPYPHGGGIWLGAGTTSTIVRTVVDGNLATARGGGIFSQGKMDLVNSLVVSNTTTASGGAGGLYVTNAGSVMMLMNCTVANNSDPGLRRDDGTVGITNCIFWNNGDDLTGTITVAYSDIQTVDSFWTVGINGCLTNNPLFVDATYYHEQSRIGNYTNGYFSGGGWGKSLSNSPCIDAGAANSPWSLEPAPSGRRANMGAYGNTPVASLSAVMQGSMFMFR